MGHNTFGQYDNVFPLLAPADLGSTATNLPSVALKGAHRVAFLLQQGVTTPNATTDIIDITVVAATCCFLGSQSRISQPDP